MPGYCGFGDSRLQSMGNRYEKFDYKYHVFAFVSNESLWRAWRPVHGDNREGVAEIIQLSVDNVSWIEKDKVSKVLFR
jgi:hypothetical protein